LVILEEGELKAQQKERKLEQGITEQERGTGAMMKVKGL
jgi:hypothetical protein